MEIAQGGCFEMIRRLFFSIALVALIAAGIGYTPTPARAAVTSLADYLPSNTAVYADLTTPDVKTTVNGIAALLARLGVPVPSGNVFPLIDLGLTQVLKRSVTFDKDIAPWLGTNAAVGLIISDDLLNQPMDTRTNMPRTLQGLAVIGIKDRAAATAFLEAIFKDIEAQGLTFAQNATTFRGVDAISYSNAILGLQIVLTADAIIIPINGLDISTLGATTLSSDAKFQKTLALLPAGQTARVWIGNRLLRYYANVTFAGIQAANSLYGTPTAIAPMVSTAPAAYLPGVSDSAKVAAQATTAATRAATVRATTVATTRATLAATTAPTTVATTAATAAATTAATLAATRAATLAATSTATAAVTSAATATAAATRAATLAVTPAATGTPTIEQSMQMLQQAFEIYDGIVIGLRGQGKVLAIDYGTSINLEAAQKLSTQMGYSVNLATMYAKQKPLTLKLFDQLPNDALAVIYGTDLAAFYRALKTQALALDTMNLSGSAGLNPGQAAAFFTEIESGLKENLELDINEDILSWLGGDFAAYMVFNPRSDLAAASRGQWPFDHVLLVDSSDAPRSTAFIAKLNSASSAFGNKPTRLSPGSFLFQTENSFRIGLAQVDNTFVLSTGSALASATDAINGNFGQGRTTAAWTNAKAVIPADASQVLYLDITRIAAVVNQQIAFGDITLSASDRQALRAIDQFESALIYSAVKGPGEMTGTAALILK